MIAKAMGIGGGKKYSEKYTVESRVPSYGVLNSRIRTRGVALVCLVISWNRRIERKRRKEKEKGKRKDGKQKGRKETKEKEERTGLRDGVVGTNKRGTRSCLYGRRELGLGSS